MATYVDLWSHYGVIFALVCLPDCNFLFCQGGQLVLLAKKGKGEI